MPLMVPSDIIAPDAKVLAIGLWARGIFHACQGDGSNIGFNLEIVKKYLIIVWSEFRTYLNDCA